MKVLSSEAPVKFSLPDYGNEVFPVSLAQQLLSVADVLTKGSIIQKCIETYWFHSIVQMVNGFRKKWECCTTSDSQSLEAMVIARNVLCLFSVLGGHVCMQASNRLVVGHREASG